MEASRCSSDAEGAPRAGIGGAEVYLYLTLNAPSPREALTQEAIHLENYVQLIVHAYNL